MLKIKKILSRQNNQIKCLRKLSLKKYRHQTNTFTVENLAIIFDALKSDYTFKELFVTQDFIDRHKEKFQYLQKHAASAEYYLINEPLNKYASQLDTPAGIIAVYEQTPSNLDQSQSAVYLNGIKDPGNLGTILRTALAFNVPNIIVDPTCVDVYNFKTISAAKDSIFKLNITEDKQGTWLKEHKDIWPIYVANSQGGVALSKVKGARKFCLVLGNESHGVSKDIIKLADKNIYIEISEQIESLNVATAAAILLHRLQQKT